MFKRLALLVVALTVTGCTLFKEETQQVQVWCSSLSASITTLADHKHKLTSIQIDTINDMLIAVYPICGTGEEPVYNDINRATLTEAKKQIEKLLEKVN